MSVLIVIVAREEYVYVYSSLRALEQLLLTHNPRFVNSTKQLIFVLAVPVSDN